ncbi:MAG: DUF4331 family protein [Massilia sp.]
MSHHYSGPNIEFPRGDARLDLTDLYAFPKPGDPGKSIFIMDFHPSAGLNPTGPTTDEAFAPEARYELLIDTDGDTVADIGYEVCVAKADGGGQKATLRRFEGPQGSGARTGGTVLADGAPVSTGKEALITQAGEHRFFAGWRSDPFFFDVLGVIDNFQFKKGDFFTDKDVCSIALEIPNALFGAKPLGVWARSLVSTDGAGGAWVQADRGARPNQTPFLSGDHNAEYLTGEPADDARFIPVFAHSLEHTGGYTPDEAKQAAAKLLPDILIYDPSRPAAFPTNGRALADDVSDRFLAILTNGKVMGDNVGPHNDLLDEFPYLGPPHKDRH